MKTAQPTTAFSEWLQAKRESLGMSQNELILTCDLSARTISSFNSGKLYPSTGTIIKLREGLHLSDEELVEMFDAITADMVTAGKLDTVIE